MGQNLDCCRGGPNPGGGSVVETGLMTLDHQQNHGDQPKQRNQNDDGQYSRRSDRSQKDSAASNGRKKRKNNQNSETTGLGNPTSSIDKGNSKEIQGNQKGMHGTDQQMKSGNNNTSNIAGNVTSATAALSQQVNNVANSAPGQTGQTGMDGSANSNITGQHGADGKMAGDAGRGEAPLQNKVVINVGGQNGGVQINNANAEGATGGNGGGLGIPGNGASDARKLIPPNSGAGGLGFMKKNSMLPAAKDGKEDQSKEDQQKSAADSQNQSQQQNAQKSAGGLAPNTTYAKLQEEPSAQAKKNANLTSTRRKSRLDGLHRAPIAVPNQEEKKEDNKVSQEEGAKGRVSKIESNKLEPDLIKDKVVGTGKTSPRDEVQAQQKQIKVNVKNFAILQKKEIKSTYKIKETLGQGSFGCVKRIMHRDLNEDRALKIIKRTSVSSDSDFLNEIGMLKSIDHPNVLKYFECYQDEFNYYIVTEFCPGGELLSYIVKERGINDWQAAFIMKQVMSAVNYCHSRGIVHRDLKVENVLVKEVVAQPQGDEYGSRKRINVKLIDFGISCRIKPHQRLNKFFGTPYYMAPEVIKRDYTEKCDLWACGVILYIIMCGYPPFRAQTLKGLQKVILEGKYDFRDQFWGDVWPETKDLIKKLLIVDQQKRLSAREALAHPFFEALRRDVSQQQKQQNKKQISQAFQNLRNFNAEAKIQTALKAYLANFCIQDDYEQELNRVFQEIDRNRDGTISKNEFRNGTYQFFGERAFMLEEEVDRIFDLVDMNGNGVIDYSEFISSAANVNQLMSEKQMKAAFKAFDLDGSGEISFEEFEETFSAGLDIEKEELRKIFTEFDHNKNGLINFEEFKSFMKRLFKIISNKQKQVQVENSP